MTMRAWILLAAVLTGLMSSVICHVTCALSAAPIATADAEPACHKMESAAGGSALEAVPCRHADRDSQDAKATAVFQLTALDASPLELDAWAPVAARAGVVIAAVSSSPPPLLIPLRI